MPVPHTLLPSPLGPLSIHFTPLAVTKISFTKPDEEPLINGLPDQVDVCIAELSNYFEGKSFGFSFAHDQAGTIFQHSVWDELQKVKPGETLSYQQLSKRLHNPLAIRAVANANGKNSLAIVIPCHRIIGSDGSLTGYAGELWRKKWLLQHEAKFLKGAQTLF